MLTEGRRVSYVARIARTRLFDSLYFGESLRAHFVQVVSVLLVEVEEEKKH